MKVPAASARAEGVGWRSEVWLGAGLVLLFGLLYPGVLLGSESFFFRDYGFFGYPLAVYHRESFWRGELPFWNPLSECGLPFAAQWNTMVFYPGSLIYLLFPAAWGLGLFCVGHLVFAGVGMHRLALNWTGHRFGAVAAGMVFAANGLAFNSLMWPALCAGFGWMPWVVLAVDRAVQGGGWRTLCWAGLVGAMQMLTGAAEIVLLTWGFAGCGVLARLLARGVLERGRERAPEIPPPSPLPQLEASRSGGRWRVAGAALGRFAVVVCLVSALSAVQLLPFFDLLRQSHRDAEFGSGFWSMPGTGLAHFLVPLFQAYPARQGVFFQHEQHWTSSYYFGVIALALAVWGAAAGGRRGWFLGVMALLGVVLAMGDQGWVLPWLKRGVPVLGYVQYPIKFVFLTMFAGALLVAEALARWERGGAGSSIGPRSLVTVGAILLAGIGAVVWYDAAYPLFTTVPSHAGQSGASRAAFLLGGLAVLGWLRRTVGVPKGMDPAAAVGVTRATWAARTALVLLLGFDAATHTTLQNPVVPAATMQPGLIPALNKLRPLMDPLPVLGDGRAMLSPEADRALRVTSMADPQLDYLANRQGLFSNLNLLDDLPKVNGFFPLFLRDSHAVILALYRESELGRRFDPVLDYLGASQMTAPGGAFQWLRRPGALPMVTAGQRPVFGSEREILDRLLGGSFDPRAQVFLPESARGLVPGGALGRVELVGVRVGRQRIEAEYRSEAPGLVSVSQAYANGWRATVNGVAAPVLRANHGFQAVLVPQGSGRLVLEYRAPGFALGGVISAAGLMFCLWGAVRRGSGRE